jgi:hypothetical protein
MRAMLPRERWSQAQSRKADLLRKVELLTG